MIKPKSKSTQKAVNVSIEEIVDLFNNRLFELFYTYTVEPPVSGPPGDQAWLSAYGRYPLTYRRLTNTNTIGGRVW